MKLPRCTVGSEVYTWTGESNCRFLGGSLTYLKRSKCAKGHADDQWRRVRKCVYEPLASGTGVFAKLTALDSARLHRELRIVSKYPKVGAEKLLSRHGHYWDKKHDKGFVKFVAKSKPTTLDGLSVSPGAADVK